MSKRSTVSSASSSVNTTSSNEKNHMKEFIIAVREYNKTKSDEVASTLGRLLQLLGMSLDPSSFNPDSNVVTEFFVSLYELMSDLNSGSQLIWASIGVLQQACKNRAAHKALIHVYQFIPVLSRFLGDHLSREKKRKLLGLMQELTYGIKISWQISYLPSVLTTLVKWIESGDETIVSLALGVLLNMCHGNLPVVYTLMRTTDTKQFLRKILLLRSPLTEVQVCKLLITLEHVTGEVPEADLLNFVRVTFRTINEAFGQSDLVRLRHIVEFFHEIRLQMHRASAIRAYENYEHDVNQVLDELEVNLQSQRTDKQSDLISNSKRDPTDAECVSLIYDILRSLIELEVPEIRKLYSRIVNLALGNVHTEIAGPSSLALLTSVASHDASIQDLELLVDELPTFVRDIQTDPCTPGDRWSRTTAVLRLINSVARHSCLVPRIFNALGKEVMQGLFDQLFNAELEGSTHESTHEVHMYALSLVCKLAHYDDRVWGPVVGQLLANKQIQAIVARTLLAGTQETRAIALEAAAAQGFPVRELSKMLCTVQPAIAVNDISRQGSNNSCCHSGDNGMGLMYPIMTGTQIEQLDRAIARLKEAFNKNQISSVATSEVLELYEYKVAAMGHAERLAQASLDAANKQAAHLQHRLAQMSAETSRHHQLLFHAQQRQEHAQEQLRVAEQSIQNLNSRLAKDQQKIKSQSELLAEKEKAIEQHLEVIRTYEGKLEQVMENVNQLTRKCEDQALKNKALMKASVVMEEKNKNLEQVIREKEDTLADRDTRIVNLVKDVNDLGELRIRHEGIIANREKDLADTLKDLADANEELNEKRKILDAITKLTTTS